MEIEGTRIFDGRKVSLKETDRALTPLGGMVVFLEFLNKIGFVKKVIECMPIIHRSPNSILPAQTYIAFLISVAAGSRRFAQTSWLRGDRALHGQMGLDRSPSNDTIRNLFLRFGMGEVQRFFEPMTEWIWSAFHSVPKGIAWTWIRRCLSGMDNNRKAHGKATIRGGQGG